MDTLYVFVRKPGPTVTKKDSFARVGWHINFNCMYLDPGYLVV